MEQVVLVDENNNEIGLADKDTVHHQNTPLHRAFSLFVFNSKNELLVTQRAQTKKTFPGVWTNTVCGHLSSGETTVLAAKRRLKAELGIDISETEIREVAPYRYKFTDQNGMVENEICPVLVAVSDIDPKPNRLEVNSWKWVKWGEFLIEIEKNTRNYSLWSVEEAKILATRLKKT